MKRWILYVASFPADVICWLIILTMWLCFGHQLQWKHGVLTFELKRDSWPQRTWYAGWGGTTFGHGIMFAVDHLDWDPIWLHELVHVEQFEAECLQNTIFFAICTLLGFWWVGLIWWAGAPLLGVLAGYTTAWLRGEEFYMGSHLEEAARAVATCRKRNIEV